MFFGYQKEDYFNSKSKERIFESRLKKLNNITEQSLQIIKELIEKNACTRYQEKNIDRIKANIREIINN